MLDHIHIFNREVIARGNLLRRHPETLTENEDIEITAGDVLLCLEDLKRLDERFGTDLGIQGNPVMKASSSSFDMVSTYFAWRSERDLRWLRKDRACQ